MLSTLKNTRIKKSLKTFLWFIFPYSFSTLLNTTVQNTTIEIFLLLIADIIFATVCFDSNYSSRFFGDVLHLSSELSQTQLFFSWHHFLRVMI